MENEVVEVLEEGTVNEVNNVNKPSKGTFLGIVAAVTGIALLVKFRKKIGSKIDNFRVNKLTKKGYTVNPPVKLDTISEDLLEEIK